VEETGVPGENHRPVLVFAASPLWSTSIQTYHGENKVYAMN